MKIQTWITGLGPESPVNPRLRDLYVCVRRRLALPLPLCVQLELH